MSHENVVMPNSELEDSKVIKEHLGTMVASVEIEFWKQRSQTYSDEITNLVDRIKAKKDIYVVDDGKHIYIGDIKKNDPKEMVCNIAYNWDTVLDIVNQCTKINGCSKDESEYVIVNFKQAIFINILSGDHLRALTEHSPYLIAAICRGLKVDAISALKEMSIDGKLTADVIIDAILSQKGVIQTDYYNLPDSVT